MTPIQTRRDFLKTTMAGAVLAAGTSLIQSAETPKTIETGKKASDLVSLGSTGLKPSFLAQGCGYNGGARHSDHTRMGKPAFEKLVRHGFENGIRFLDTADLYGTHTYLRDVIKSMSREKLVILSKLWPTEDYWNRPSGGAKVEVNRFRRELGVDNIDIVLIHCMGSKDWPEKYTRIRDELSELKSSKAIRAVGVSCHDLGALKTASEHPWVDVIFARINNRGRDCAMDGSPEEVAPVLKTARANGKFVVGMKIFGAGKLVSPEQKAASLKYVIGNQLVDAMTIGMKSPEEVDDTIQCVNAALKT